MGRAWAASGSMCEVTGCAIPTGLNEPLYGRTDTKSQMVYSSMVHVAGGEGGSIRHDDDGRPAPYVVTVSTVLRRPAPATRTQTLASLLEISRPLISLDSRISAQEAFDRLRRISNPKTSNSP
jgi:hypothetical protein